MATGRAKLEGAVRVVISNGQYLPLELLNHLLYELAPKTVQTSTSVYSMASHFLSETCVNLVKIGTIASASAKLGENHMASYRKVAVIAANLISGGDCIGPADAWAKAAKKVFPSSTSLRNKGCPRGAFLGLCEEGFVNGAEPSSHANRSKNGEYAVEAVNVLRRNKFLASQPDLLWKKIAGNTKTQNHQMDVVVGLWEAGVIEPRK